MTKDNDIERTLGRLLEGMETFRDRLASHEAHDAVNMARMELKLDAINDTLAQAKGGWKTLLLIAGVAGTLGAIGSKLIGFLGSLPR